MSTSHSVGSSRQDRPSAATAPASRPSPSPCPMRCRRTARHAAPHADQHIAAVLGRNHHHVVRCAALRRRAQMAAVSAGQSVPMTSVGPLAGGDGARACARRDRRRAGARARPRCARPVRGTADGVRSGVHHSVTGPIAAAGAVATVRSISRACSAAAACAPSAGISRVLASAGTGALRQDGDGDWR